MKLTVPAKVTATQEMIEYYPKTGKYVCSTLTVTENEQDITGHITIREQLELGKFYDIQINTNEVRITKDVA